MFMNKLIIAEGTGKWLNKLTLANATVCQKILIVEVQLVPRLLFQTQLMYDAGLFEKQARTCGLGIYIRCEVMVDL